MKADIDVFYKLMNAKTYQQPQVAKREEYHSFFPK